MTRTDTIFAGSIPAVYDKVLGRNSIDDHGMTGQSTRRLDRNDPAGIEPQVDSLHGVRIQEMGRATILVVEDAPALFADYVRLIAMDRRSPGRACGLCGGIGKCRTGA